jgi:predicted RNase H-like nuclease (RuvC/YqgF family)
MEIIPFASRKGRDDRRRNIDRPRTVKMEYLPTIYWVFAGIGGFLSLCGIGKLLQMAYKAALDRREVQRTLDQTNAGKEIDADVNAFNSICKRLEMVETRLDSVQSQFTEQKVENAKLEAENARLSKDNERQEKEIERQRTRLHGFANDLQQRDAQILKLTLAVEQQQKEIEELRKQLAPHGATV